MTSVLLFVLLLTAAPDYSQEIAAALDDTRTIWPVPAALVRAVIRQESAFNPRAVSAAGAVGLMQVMPFNAMRLGLTAKDRYDPRLNTVSADLRASDGRAATRTNSGTNVESTCCLRRNRGGRHPA